MPGSVLISARSRLGLDSGWSEQRLISMEVGGEGLESLVVSRLTVSHDGMLR